MIFLTLIANCAMIAINILYKIKKSINIKNLNGKIKILMVNFVVVLGEMDNIRWMLRKKFQKPHHKSLTNFNIQFFKNTS